MRVDKILVIRNDKLGDFMLAWPAFALLKQQYPDAVIVALVPAYTRDLAELCPSIDETLIDDRHESTLSDAVYLSRKIRAAKIDASISFYSEFRTALALWLARVPLRIAPATKLAQIFINRRLAQRRSESLKPEHEYNTALSTYFIELQGDAPSYPVRTPYLSFAAGTVRDLRDRYSQVHDIAHDTTLIIVHPGSGGSAINLSVRQYADLIHGIAGETGAHFIITAGPGENDTADALSALLGDVAHSVHISTQGIVEFSRFIAMCDLFISGSTGTLHIAGALDTPTVAFYPARRSATALRWQTLNSPERRIAFSPERNSGENDMQTLDLADCAGHIIAFLRRCESFTHNG